MIKKINFIQNKAFELCLFLSLPASMALIVGSEEITSALFGYGAFDVESVSKFCKSFILLCTWTSGVCNYKSFFDIFICKR